VRGVGVAKHSKEIGVCMLRYILMRTFNQPYSEVSNIPLGDAFFFINYEEAIQGYIKQEIIRQRKK